MYKLLIYKDVKNIDEIEHKTFGAGLRDWSCKKSPFMNREHGCIITEALRFIENKNLGKVINKQSSFPKARNINWYWWKNITTKKIVDCNQRLFSNINMP